MGTAIPCDLVRHGKHVWLHRTPYEKEEIIPIYNEIYTSLFLELSAFETNSKQVKAFVLRKFNPKHPKSA